LAVSSRFGPLSTGTDMSSGQGLVSTRLESRDRLVRALQHGNVVLMPRSHRTSAPLSFPPHIIALGSIYAASILLQDTTQTVPTPKSDEDDTDGRSATDLVQLLGSPGNWETEYLASADHIDSQLYRSTSYFGSLP
jgi:hypothetical protein